MIMSESSDKIRAIKAYPFNQYAGISSREKLVVYAIKYLTEQGIETTFDYVCVTAFKLFPEEFKLSAEFPEFPDIAGLNRTLMHLRPEDRDLATGKTNTNYKLTKKGQALADMVSEGLEKGIYTAESVVRHDEVKKKLDEKDYLEFISKEAYKLFLSNNQYELTLIWQIFGVIPFTNLEKVLAKLKNIIDVAESKSDTSCLNLAQRMYADLKDLIEKKKTIEKGKR